MKNRKVKLGVLILLIISLTRVEAQETLDAAGGNASGGGGTSSYSIGQMVYTLQTGPDGSVMQGVQLAYEIFSVGMEDIESISLSCSVYPNPTSDYLILNIEGELETQFVASLYDLNGKLLEIIPIQKNLSHINTKNLAAATYFLKVIQGKRELKTFKIIKY